MPIELGSFSLGAIAGGIVIGIANHFLSKSRNREDRSISDFNKAAAEFRDAFINEQRLIDPNSLADRASAGSASVIVKNAISKHEAAMMKFEPFVSKGSIEDYKKAWH